MDKKNEVFGDRLRKLRGKRSQQIIADSLGISRPRYSHYENNHVEPDMDMIRKIADYYDVSVDYLLGRTGEQAIQGEKSIDDPLTNLMFDGWDEMDEETRREALDYIEYLREKKKKK